ncbi:MAG: hypothetical protein M1444_01185 [Patescibacteria group bacterium]|nr:hypothetical protein [Patescibacteria group bacterium]
MRKYKRLNQKLQEEFPKHDSRVFRETIKRLKEEGWESDEQSVYFDEDWGWVVLADKKTDSFGVVLRRIKPVQITIKFGLEKAKNLQARLRKDLVEILPYELKADKNRNTKINFLEPLFRLS